MHQNEEDQAMFANAKGYDPKMTQVVDAAQAATAKAAARTEQILNKPGPKRLKGRAAAKRRSVIGLIGRGLFIVWALFTFMSGFIFVNIPLFNLLVRSFNTNIASPINRWYIENGSDSHAVVVSLMIATSIFTMFAAWSIIQKYDIDLTAKHMFLKYVWNPLRKFFAPNKRKPAAVKPATKTFA
jgi:hypothetical protein